MNNLPPPPPPPAGYYYAPPPPAPARTSAAAIVAAFVGILLLVALIVAAIVFLSQPLPPVAPCQPGVPCVPPASHRPVSIASPRASAPPATIAPSPRPTPGGSQVPGSSPAPTPTLPVATPVSDSPPVISGALWPSDSLGYSFEYDPEDFALGDSTDDTTTLNGIFFDAQVRVRAVPATTSPAELIESELAFVDRFVLGRAPDTDDYDALLGPSIGYLGGDGGVYSGTLIGRDGTPIEPVGVAILSSSDGRLTVAVTVIAGQPDLRLGLGTHQHAVRQSADLILKTFDWDTAE